MMSRDPQFQDWIDEANAVSMLDAAKKCGAQLKRNGQEWSGPCPNCGGKDRFSINPTKNKWNCRGAEGGNTAIGMVMHIGKLSFTEAGEELTGRAPPNGKSKPLSDAEKAKRAAQRAASEAAQRQREADQEQYEADTTEAAIAIWNACKPIKGTLAETYLASRGLTDLPALLPLGFHPALPYPGRGKMPALVCRVTDVDDQTTAVWRIYLSADGKSKADVEFAKLGLGPAGGGAVRLGGVGDHIGIAEGVETALAVMKMNAYGHRLEGAYLAYPVWSALSTSGLVAIELPLTVERVTIFPDGDNSIRKKDGVYVPVDVPPGRKAALALRDRLVGEGVKCVIAAEPGPGLDYCDLWNAAQREVA